MNRLETPSFFPGGNTCHGFYSLFKYIMPKPDKLYIIKGGPGTGKSTMLKKIARYFLNQGVPVELFYCASDSDSLDGVALPTAKAAVIDGTAPHVIDPQQPGAIDEIVDLGQYLEKDRLQRYKMDILDTQKRVRQFFKLTYNYLFQAKTIKRRLQIIHRAGGPTLHKPRSMEQALLNTLPAPLTGSSPVQNRFLFGSALTPEGNISLYESFIQKTAKIYLIEDDHFPDTETLMKTLLKELNQRNYEALVLRCALDPKQIDCLYLPELNIAWFRDNLYHPFELKSFPNTESLTKGTHTVPAALTEELQETRTQYRISIQDALNTLARAKEARLGLEEIYRFSQNFSSVENTGEKLINLLEDQVNPDYSSI